MKPDGGSTETLKNRVLRTAAGLWTARQAVMLEDTRRTLANEDAVANAHHSRHLGALYKPVEAEEMGDIRIGDDVHHHHAPVAKAQSPAWPMVIAALLSAAGLLAAGASLPGLLSLAPASGERASPLPDDSAPPQGYALEPGALRIEVTPYEPTP